MAAHEKPPAAPEGAPAPTGMKAKLPLIAFVSIALAVGGGTGALVLGPMAAKKMGKAIPTHAKDGSGEHPAEAGAKAEGGGEAAAGEHEGGAAKEGGKEGEKAADAPTMHLLENLVLNPAGSGGSRFLLFNVAIELGSKTAGTEFTARDAELRDIVLTELGTKTVEQLVDMAAREAIKLEVQAAIAKRFGKSAVKRLYFPQFVVQ